jgi:hypothetical protein
MAVFLLIGSLLSTNSASGKTHWDFPTLFVGFFDTTDPSDSPSLFIPTDWLWAFMGRSIRASPLGERWGLPVPALEVSIRAEGLRLRQSVDKLTLALVDEWPFASLNSIGDRGFLISRLNTSPVSAPVNAS